MFYRTLDHIERAKDFPLNVYQVIAKNQYVNVNDILGKRIYEHDVVMITPENKGSPVTGVVRWRYGAFIIEPFSSTEQLTAYYSLRFGKMTVVGDIYHNKNKHNKDAIVHGGDPCTTKNIKKANTIIAD